MTKPHAAAAAAGGGRSLNLNYARNYARVSSSVDSRAARDSVRLRSNSLARLVRFLFCRPSVPCHIMALLDGSSGRLYHQVVD